MLPDTSKEIIPFFPLLGLRQYDREALENASDNSLYKVMLKRYDDYVSMIVEPFFNDYFKKVDRQVVLIDVLKALSGGRTNFPDFRKSTT